MKQRVTQIATTGWNPSFDTTGAHAGFPTLVCVQPDTLERLRRERDEAREHARAATINASIVARRARELEAEVAMLRPILEFLDTERDRLRMR